MRIGSNIEVDIYNILPARFVPPGSLKFCCSLPRVELDPLGIESVVGECFDIQVPSIGKEYSISLFGQGLPSQSDYRLEEMSN